MVGAAPRVATTVVAGLALLLPGCSAESPGANPAPSRPEVVEGRFDVGGHKLFLSCEGSGSPSVLYVHGSITEPQVDPHVNGEPVRRLLSGDYRVCLYDRRNLGQSDTVDAPQRPDDALRDLRRLLAAADVDPPYVLLGASFGGMLAYLYANQHPDEVVGMVLLDAMFPDELSLEHLVAPGDRYKAFDRTDEDYSLERISHYQVQKAAQRYIGHEPEIPVVYLASDTEGYEDDPAAGPEYNRRVLEAQAAYVDRFSPGTLVRVQAPHFMEPVIPDQIAEAVRDVAGGADG